MLRNLAHEDVRAPTEEQARCRSGATKELQISQTFVDLFSTAAADRNPGAIA